MSKIVLVGESEMTKHTEAAPGISPRANPVFVVGIFRSGTSLLYSLLNQHPEIALMYETDVWDFPQPLSRIRFRGNWLERQEFYNQALSRHRLVFGGRVRGLEEVRTPDELYRVFGRGKQAAFWGEKSPVYCDRLRLLAERYPGCSIILLWRDPVEIFRSVFHAGAQSRFFRRRSMLNRIIRYQEQMIEQATDLVGAGARVHHVTYADLIDRAGETCRGICQFLGVEFDERMLDLARADLTAVYHAPQHDYLRRGIIERRRLSDGIMPPRVLKKLHRFRARWHRMNAQWFPLDQENGTPEPEPSLPERVYHRVAGSILCGWDNCKRALFEFLPLPWLRTYRLTVSWLLARGSGLPADRRSLVQEFRAHWITILATGAMMCGIGMLHVVSDPRMSFLPLYLVPCVAVTLVVGPRWGTLVAIASALLGPIMQSQSDPDFAHVGVLLWNSSMRFALFEAIVLLVNRVRIEIASHASKA